MNRTVRDWASANFEPKVEPFERTMVLHRTPDELLDGCTVKEVDIEVDTIPGELLDLLVKR